MYQGGIGSYALLVMVAAFLLGAAARRSWPVSWNERP